MATSVLDRPDVTAGLDAGTGRWHATVGAGRYTVREWTWGERWRLVDGCTRGGGFDRGAFVDHLLGLLVTPVPAGGDRALVAAVTLRLLGVEPGARPASLLAAEAALIRAWGVGPAELDAQPARRLDQHLAALTTSPATSPAAAPVSPGWDEAAGWNAIVVSDG